MSVTAITKSIRQAVAAQSYTGPTLEALNRGGVEVRTDARRAVYAKRVGLHDRLYARGKLTDAEWNWACRYVRETEIAAGARLGRPGVEPVDVWSGPLIYNRQCAAAGFLRRAHERISAQERLVLVAACVECATIADIAPLLGLARKAAETDEAFRKRTTGLVEGACARIIGTASGLSKRAEAGAF